LQRIGGKDILNKPPVITLYVVWVGGSVYYWWWMFGCKNIGRNSEIMTVFGEFLRVKIKFKKVIKIFP